jgi:tetratricopeptide (TPR) repeat protein
VAPAPDANDATPDPFADLDDDTPAESRPESAGLDLGPASAHVAARALRHAPVPAETTAPDFELPAADLAEAAPPAPETEPGADAFDLAAALCADLETGDPGAGGVATDEDGFHALFRDFKRGVEQQLGAEDGEARYDLGIAYREMGLLEDALGEFAAAVQTPARHLDALHMLGLCSLDLGRAGDAVVHLGRALAAPDVPPPQQAALRLDLGRAHEALGESELALEAYRSAGALDPELPGLAARIATLERAGAGTPAGAGPAYESFEDLLAEKDEVEAGAPAEPAYESFQDVLADAAESPAPDPPPAREADPAPDRAPAAEAAAEPPAAKAPRRKRISFF